MTSIQITLPLLALALLSGCGKSHDATASQAKQQTPAKVRVGVAHYQEAPMLMEVTGSVRPVQRAMIAAKIMGTIEEMPVSLGQHVKAGQLLLKISAAEISAKVLQAQAQLNMATRDLERERELLTKSASTADMVKGLQERFNMTQAMVKEAEVMLSYTSVRAPFDGVVSRKMTDAGSLAAPGIPMLEIEGSDAFHIETGVPDSMASTLKEGASLKVEIPDSNTSFNGTLAEISSAADAFSRTVQVKISIPSGARVRSGQFARVLVPGALQRALFIPAASVSTLGQMERVYVAHNNHAVLRLVKTGAVRGDQIEILSGIAEGEQLIQNAGVSLTEGQAVEVQP